MHNDNELFTIAQVLLEQRHTPPVHTVAAALRSQSGEVISAVNIDHFLGFVCAETAALAIAINRGIYDFDSVVAVRKNDDTGKIEIVDMCGKCRQIFHDYTPGITVLTTSGPQAIEHILPHAFTRQRTKIQRVIKR